MGWSAHTRRPVRRLGLVPLARRRIHSPSRSSSRRTQTDQHTYFPKCDCCPAASIVRMSERRPLPTADDDGADLRTCSGLGERPARLASGPNAHFPSSPSSPRYCCYRSHTHYSMTPAATNSSSGDPVGPAKPNSASSNQAWSSVAAASVLTSSVLLVPHSRADARLTVLLDTGGGTGAWYLSHYGPL